MMGRSNTIRLCEGEEFVNEYVSRKRRNTTRQGDSSEKGCERGGCACVGGKG